jgi:tripartite-type tricarboxylate transporter receptor subunit TctC
MNLQAIRNCLAAISLVAVCAAGHAQQAEDWPSRPVRILVANPPGQAVDIIARLFADSFGRKFGQQFIVENKPGAGGMIATEMGARAAPDGYTLTVTSSGPLVITPAIRRKVAYDALKDFSHIANIALTPQSLLVGSNSPLKSVADLVALAKKNPELNYATSGIGSTSHLTMEAFASAAGLKLNHVPFKGNQELLAQLAAGEIPVGLDTVPGALGMIKSGRVRAIGVAAPERSPFLPDVPTLIEQGVDAVGLGWIGLSGPAGLPRPIVTKVNQAIQEALEEPAFKERFAAMAFVSIASSPEEFTAFIAAERDKWNKVARDANVVVE